MVVRLQGRRDRGQGGGEVRGRLFGSQSLRARHESPAVKLCARLVAAPRYHERCRHVGTQSGHGSLPAGVFNVGARVAAGLCIAEPPPKSTQRTMWSLRRMCALPLPPESPDRRLGQEASGGRGPERCRRVQADPGRAPEQAAQPRANASGDPRTMARAMRGRKQRTWMSSSKRPGRRSAASSTSRRFVAPCPKKQTLAATVSAREDVLPLGVLRCRARTTTRRPSALSMPSISLSSVESTRS